MCENIKIVRIILFFIVFFMTMIAIFYARHFCKGKGIDFNTFSGMLEMFSRVFKFEEKVFSVLILVSMYGGALIMLITIGISLWAEGKGCVFPTQHH